VKQMFCCALSCRSRGWEVKGREGEAAARTPGHHSSLFLSRGRNKTKSMSCPFRAVFGRVTPAGDEDSTAAPPGVCPFTGAKAGGADGAACPASATAARDSNAAAADAPPPATCPFGFGGGKSKAGLGELDCPK
jgi:hypothetical protein